MLKQQNYKKLLQDYANQLNQHSTDMASFEEEDYGIESDYEDDDLMQQQQDECQKYFEVEDKQNMSK